MAWKVAFYSGRLEEDILALPAGLVARFVKYAEKTPLKELQIARQRMKEMVNG